MQADLALPAALAFILSAFGVYAGIRLGPRTGAVAAVRPDRWHADGVVPKLAGPGLALGLAVALPPGAWITAALAGVIGIIDDHRRLGVTSKALLLLLPAAAAITVTELWWTGPAVWIAANSLNLLDHADGVAAAAAMAVCLFGGATQGPVAAAAIAGFMIFNLPPARSFMGDGGSLMLGTALVLLSAEQGIATTASWLLLPLADTALVVISRLRRGQKPWVGGTDHSGHRLLRTGLSAHLVPWLYFLVAGLAAGIFAYVLKA
jgi:UDP-GlcNAc:undecaprenyl-phosphate GlcNAc-1-phosphate transferase